MSSYRFDSNELPEWARFYRGKRVLVTGHTGFKGSWLSEWLLTLGARVSGYSLDPDTEPSLFRQLGLKTRLDHRIGDIRDPAAFGKAVRAARPEVIFHLAAQPLVRQSYVDPVTTYDTNVMGTVYLLNFLREWTDPCAAVFVTSDKCYRNEEGGCRNFQENDPMGGADPYSSSKGCAELAIHSFRQSYFSDIDKNLVRVASARAGNVIGGGDWAPDRIVPDCVRSLSANTPIRVRNRHAVRPWQHVLEPLRGYLMLGYYIFPEGGASVRQCVGMETEGKNQQPATSDPSTDSRLAENPLTNSGPADNQQLTTNNRQPPSNNEQLPTSNNEFSSFNFGPSAESHRTVEYVLREILRHWPGDWVDATDPAAPHEAGYLSLDSDRARRCLGWMPIWDLETTLKETVTWYRDTCATTKDEVREITGNQIRKFTRDSSRQGKTTNTYGE